MKRGTDTLLKEKTFCDIAVRPTTSEYGQSEDWKDAGGTKNATGFLFVVSLACHLSNVIALGCADEAQEGNRILSLKLSERVKPFCLLILQGAFLFLWDVLFLLKTVSLLA